MRAPTCLALLALAAALAGAPATVRGQCSGSCRATTASSGTLHIFDSTCASSTRWSTRSPLNIVERCQTWEYLGTVQAGSCAGRPDGFQYAKIKFNGYTGWLQFRYNSDLQCCTAIDGAYVAGSTCPRPCLSITPSRAGLAAAARALVGRRITYTQLAGSPVHRWSGIRTRVCPTAAVPAYADCSSFVTWIYWAAFGQGPDLLNGKGWSEGYTGTLASRGRQVSRTTYTSRGAVAALASTAAAQPGDLVFYGKSTHSHVAMYVGGGQVVSFGGNEKDPKTGKELSYGLVKQWGVNYHPDPVDEIRTYPSFFTYAWTL